MKNTRLCQRIKKMMKMALVSIFLFGLMLIFVAPIGMFYRGFYIHNDTGKDIQLTLYASRRGEPNAKDFLLGVYESSSSVIPYYVVDYPLVKNRILALGFDMDDHYPSWIEIKDNDGKLINAEISFDEHCLFTIRSHVDTQQNGATKVKEDQISCDSQEYFTELSQHFHIVTPHPDLITPLNPN